MLDAESYQATHGQHPSSKALAVTPADSNLADFTRSLYIGGAGDVALLMADEFLAGGTTVVIFSNVIAGTVLPFRVAQVRATDTTATNIVAIF